MDLQEQLYPPHASGEALIQDHGWTYRTSYARQINIVRD